eukprot:297846-Chlamydomonas_euryale.AAC.12
MFHVAACARDVHAGQGRATRTPAKAPCTHVEYEQVHARACLLLYMHAILYVKTVLQQGCTCMLLHWLVDSMMGEHMGRLCARAWHWCRHPLCPGFCEYKNEAIIVEVDLDNQPDEDDPDVLDEDDEEPDSDDEDESMIVKFQVSVSHSCGLAQCSLLVLV